ncbi:hypothetical protein IIY68_01065 [Candidatus Saccharibacteria bacterium]|nr:hypothetical protein [Candidatus Saccharibacteria bacterium]
MTPEKENKIYKTTMTISLAIGGITILALLVGVALPINSTARNVCVAIVGFNISLVVVLWVIAKLKMYFLYKNWKAEQAKQESKQPSKKKGKK